MVAQTRSQSRRAKHRAAQGLMGLRKMKFKKRAKLIPVRYHRNSASRKAARAEFDAAWDKVVKAGGVVPISKRAISRLEATITAIVKASAEGRLHERYNLSKAEGLELI